MSVRDDLYEWREPIAIITVTCLVVAVSISFAFAILPERVTYHVECTRDGAVVYSGAGQPAFDITPERGTFGVPQSNGSVTVEGHCIVTQEKR